MTKGRYPDDDYVLNVNADDILGRAKERSYNDSGYPYAFGVLSVVLERAQRCIERRHRDIEELERRLAEYE